MPRNEEALARARSWAAWNFAPSPIRAPDLGPAPDETDAEKLRILEAAANLTTTRRDGGGQPPSTRGRAAPSARPPSTINQYVAATVVVGAGGGGSAKSWGPIPYPWHLTSLTLGGGLNQPFEGVALTATPDDATASGRTADGIPLLDAQTLGVNVLPPPYFLPDINWRGVEIIGASALMPAGYFLTFWVWRTGGGTDGTMGANIAMYPGVEINIGPDPERLQTLQRPRTPQPPSPRTISPRLPTGARISSGGFSRDIPWGNLDPVLIREITTNLYGGKQTPGVTLLY